MPEPSIYLNCAATSRDRPPCVAEAMMAAMGCGGEALGNAGRGATESELSAGRVETRARMDLARLLGAADPSRVVFCANATDALNRAILGVVRPGDRVVTTDLEHNSVLRPLNRLARVAGVEVAHARADKRGVLDLDHLRTLVTPGTRLVAATHGSNLTGNLVDIAEVARIAHEAGALVLVDASQTAGAVPLNMAAAEVDLLATAGHKALFGPQGTGILVVAPGVEVEPAIQGGTGVHSYDTEQPASYPEHLEAGTLNGPGVAGLGAGARWLLETGVEAVHAHDLALVRSFVAGLRKIDGITVYGDVPDDLALLDGVHADHGPVVAMNLEGWESSELADELAQGFGICTRAGAHCAPRMHAALGTYGRGAVRFSFGWFTTEDDVDAALAALAEIAAFEEDPSGEEAPHA